MAAFYRNLHNFFAPLHKPLSNSTNPVKVAERIAAASSTSTTTTTPSPSNAEQQPIYDLVYDPGNLTIHTSIPNIPAPGTLSAEGLSDKSGWTRVEAINVHSQTLATIAETRGAGAADQLERTAKTSRGWWVVWMWLHTRHVVDRDLRKNDPSGNLDPEQLQDESKPSATSALSDSDDASTKSVKGTVVLEIGAQRIEENLGDDRVDELRDNVPKDTTESSPSTAREAILIRRARDASSTNGSKSGARSSSGMWATMGLGAGTSSLRTGGQQAGWGPAKLAEGIGVDARRYVEGLLSLNR